MNKTTLYLRQVKTLTAANLKTRYRNTFAGFLWVLLNPLLLFTAQSFAFHYVLKINVENYFLFLVSGLLPWIFIVQSLEMCTGIVVNNARLFKSFPIHPVVNLASQLLDNLINFGGAFVLLLFPIAIHNHFPLIKLALFILPLAIMVAGVFAAVMISSLVQVFFQDTRFIVSFLTQLLFFFTPIFYPESFIPENIRWLLWANPVNYFISPFRVVVMGGSLEEFFLRCGYAAALASFFFLIAVLFWRRKQNAAYFNL